LLDDIVPLEIEGLTYQIVEEKDIMTVKGKWRGCWKCSGTEGVKNAKLSLQQKGRIVKGSLTIKVTSEEEIVTIIEEISGIIDKGKLMLDGVSPEVRPKKDKYKYQLDTFELQYSHDGTRLEGIHSCQMGKGDAIFERI
jgi:hypothetical protein